MQSERAENCTRSNYFLWRLSCEYVWATLQQCQIKRKGAKLRIVKQLHGYNRLIREAYLNEETRVFGSRFQLTYVYI